MFNWVIAMTKTAVILLTLCIATVVSPAQTITFTNSRLTNSEILLRFSSTGQVRVEASTSLPQWHPLLTLTSTGLNQHLDTATPYLQQRFYRAHQLTGTTNITGDWLTTTNGDVLIRPITHASFLMTWNGLVIYNDPRDPASLYTGLPKADLILISHHHSDHFNNSVLATVTNTNCRIIGTQLVYDGMTAPLRALTTVLTNGVTTNLLGLHVEAVPAYNQNHSPRGSCNGYVVTIGGRRLYMSGDTGATPEMRALPNIDVAFVCMNLQFTMSTTQAVDVVRAMRPKVIYPYHYSGNPVADVNWFKRQVSNDLNIEVRLRKWY
jgi:L-ascorbate metabolism protein UlaG (beta-lactamase superfamily)